MKNFKSQLSLVCSVFLAWSYFSQVQAQSLENVDAAAATADDSVSVLAADDVAGAQVQADEDKNGCYRTESSQQYAYGTRIVSEASLTPLFSQFGGPRNWSVDSLIDAVFTSASPAKGGGVAHTSGGGLVFFDQQGQLLSRGAIEGELSNAFTQSTTGYVVVSNLEGDLGIFSPARGVERVERRFFHENKEYKDFKRSLTEMGLAVDSQTPEKDKKEADRVHSADDSLEYYRSITNNGGKILTLMDSRYGTFLGANSRGEIRRYDLMMTGSALVFQLPGAEIVVGNITELRDASILFVTDAGTLFHISAQGRIMQKAHLAEKVGISNMHPATYLEDGSMIVVADTGRIHQWWPNLQRVVSYSMHASSDVQIVPLKNSGFAYIDDNNKLTFALPVAAKNELRLVVASEQLPVKDLYSITPEGSVLAVATDQKTLTVYSSAGRKLSEISLQRQIQDAFRFISKDKISYRATDDTWVVLEWSKALQRVQDRISIPCLPPGEKVSDANSESATKAKNIAETLKKIKMKPKKVWLTSSLLDRTRIENIRLADFSVYLDRDFVIEGDLSHERLMTVEQGRLQTQSLNQTYKITTPKSAQMRIIERSVQGDLLVSFSPKHEESDFYFKFSETSDKKYCLVELPRKLTLEENGSDRVIDSRGVKDFYSRSWTYFGHTLPCLKVQMQVGHLDQTERFDYDGF